MKHSLCSGHARSFVNIEFIKFLCKNLIVSTLAVSAIVATGAASYPTTPPVTICDDAAILTGPSTAPAGAITVPAGDNSSVNFKTAGATYWFAPGVHTLGTGQFGQIGPGNGCTYIGGPGAILDGQQLNQYAFTTKARNVTIEYLTVKNFKCPVDEGVINHDQGPGWTIRYCTAENNHGGAVFLGDTCQVCMNCLRNNGQYGFQVFGKDGRLDSNEISGNNADDLEHTIPGGCGCTGGGKAWAAVGCEIRGNYVHNNLSVGLWMDTNNRDFLVVGNYISDNDAEGIMYEISYNITIQDNTLIRNALVSGKARGTDPFPDGAIYMSSSSGDSTVDATYHTSEISGNWFKDNWNGVILFEASDRFCGSGANTSTGYCPLNDLSNPKRRWFTRNVHVHDNLFQINKDSLGQTGNKLCGRNGLFGDCGSVDSLYMGFMCGVGEVFLHNNKFYNNTYMGDWNFQGFGQAASSDCNNVYTWQYWRAAPPPADTLNNSLTNTTSLALYGDYSYFSATNQPPPRHGWGFGQDSGSTLSLTITDVHPQNLKRTTAQSISILRNPSNAAITFSFEGSSCKQNVSICILDMAGRMVTDLSRDFVNGRAMWTVGKHKSGVYLVKMCTKDQVLTQKFTLL